jgi:formylglycine-generating enzyme required for sulfatase activity
MRASLVMLAASFAAPGCFVSPERLDEWVRAGTSSDTQQEPDTQPVDDSDLDSDTQPVEDPDSDSDTSSPPGCPEGMVWIAPQTFQMGCTPGQQPCEEDESPVRTLSLGGFFIDRTEVTQQDWARRMGSNPAHFADCGPCCPVETVSWHEAALYANARSVAVGLTSCYDCQEEVCAPVSDLVNCVGYRLPTEAEWEAAARCGEDLGYAGSSDALEVAWTGANAEGRTHPVGQLEPNTCGLYDMSGNVWEWTGDWYGAYPTTAVPNPTGPDQGSRRVDRGGSWAFDARYARVAYRYTLGPGARSNNVGLRLVRTHP